MVAFSEFWRGPDSLEHRNKRLQLRRASLHADLLEQRSYAPALPFNQLMQADLILFVRDCLDCLRTERSQAWWPVTLLYASRQYGPFEAFARGQSARRFAQLKQVFDIEEKEDLLPLAEAFKAHRLRLPSWGIYSANPFGLMGFDRLASLP